MKKLILIGFMLVLFYGEFHYVDMSTYETKVKDVEVKGEVHKPGVYQVSRHALIKDVIDKAGGIKENGDTSHLNLSDDVVNHSVIVVQTKREKARISINAASVEELDTLSGIGPAIAQRIVEYRRQHTFRSLEELKEVKGIGDKLFEKIKDEIVL